MSWKLLQTEGQYTRYKKQPGVNVFSLFDPAADPKEMAAIETALANQFSKEAQNNELRLYATRMKLSDSGGGLKVFYNGKKMEHKGVLPGALKPVTVAINKALVRDRTQ